MYYDKKKNLIFKEKQEIFFDTQIIINQTKNKLGYILNNYIRRAAYKQIKTHSVENYKQINIKNLTLIIFKLIQQNRTSLKRKNGIIVLIAGGNFTIKALFRFFSIKYQAFFIEYEPEDFQKIQSYLIYKHQEFQTYFYGPDLWENSVTLKYLKFLHSTNIFLNIFFVTTIFYIRELFFLKIIFNKRILIFKIPFINFIKIISLYLYTFLEKT